MSPDKYTIKEHKLAVGDGHKLYVQDWGNEEAKTPIIFLHGGPGAGVKDRYKQNFDPNKQRVIFFDQRGSGQSTPTASLTHNTTADSVDDIEKLVKHLSLDKFVINGGSWGSCLALVYAINHPQKVEAMVLRGIYTGSSGENDFLLNGGWRDFFPDVWETYLLRTPSKHHENPSEYHYQKAFGKDVELAKKSVYAMAELEGSLLSIDDRHTPTPFEEFEPESMLIEMHYMKNNCFLPDKYILNNAHKLKMPIWLVQGRYDAVCPPKTAYELHQKLPNSQLIWTVAGHGNDRANYDVIRTILLSLN